MVAAIAEFSHWSLAVGDLERSSRFYNEVMAWRQVGATGPTDDDGWGPLPGREATPTASRRFVRDGQRIELISLPDAPSMGNPVRPEVHHVGLSHMTVATARSDVVLGRLVDAGVRVRQHTLASFMADSPRATQFLFEDPDGNIIETYESDGEWRVAFGNRGDSDPDEGSALGIQHLSHWSLCIGDPDRSLSFYREVLGWTELAALEWEGPGPSQVMDVGPARLTTWLLHVSGQRIEIIHFWQPPVHQRQSAHRLAAGLSHMTVIIPDDLDAIYAELTKYGGANPTITKGRLGRAIVFRDPDGHLIRGVPERLRWAS